MFTKDIIEKFGQIRTPFYFYDIDILERTLGIIRTEAKKYNFQIHYAIKANANPKILKIISNKGIGADCVSGNEILRSLECGFPKKKIVYAGVGKADWEIETALKNDIFCFNCESIPEIEVINDIAEKLNKKANIAIRINPNVDANTHHYITTGIEENKFGINRWDLGEVIDTINKCKFINLIGLHFHIGSQITDMSVFMSLCLRINDIQKWFWQRDIFIENINVGGGLGINYHEPDKENIADFKNYFSTFNRFLKLQHGQKVHFELGRSVTAACGSLISKVLYVKKGTNTKFAILDAGMSDLLRPALYQAYHKIENISSNNEEEKYDVVGPICESSDCFGKAVMLNKVSRNNLVAIRSTGAYGEIMSSQYNLRELPSAIFSDEI